MGITFIKVRVSNPANPEQVRECEFLVDSGALYSVVPEPVLRSMGIAPTSREEFILANGEFCQFPVGNAIFQFADKPRAAPVIFGTKDDVYLLGATTLEALGLALDPVRRELHPLKMFLM